LLKEINEIENEIKEIKDDENNEFRKTEIYQNHQVKTVGCKLVSEFPTLLTDDYKQFNGDNCIIDFFEYVKKSYFNALNIVNAKKDINDMIITENQMKEFNDAIKCHICAGELKDD
jgi:hypothetical protein